MKRAMGESVGSAVDAPPHHPPTLTVIELREPCSWTTKFWHLIGWVQKRTPHLTIKLQYNTNVGYFLVILIVCHI